MIEPIIRVDDSQFQTWLAKEPERETEILRLFQQEGSLLVIAEMQQQVPIRSGFLRESFASHETPNGFTVYSTASYAKYVDQGTKPHTIFPRQAKVLRFILPSGGVVFAKYVKHPGSLGQFFVRKTVDAVRGRLAELARELWRRIYG